MIVAGAILGWLAALALPAKGPRNAMLPAIAAGIAGALVSGLVVAPLVGAGDLSSGPYRVTAMLVSTLGALAVVVSTSLLHLRESR